MSDELHELTLAAASGLRGERGHRRQNEPAAPSGFLTVFPAAGREA